MCCTQNSVDPDTSDDEFFSAIKLDFLVFFHIYSSMTGEVENFIIAMRQPSDNSDGNDIKLSLFSSSFTRELEYVNTQISFQLICETIA